MDPLRLEGVNFGYGAQRVLHDLSFSVQAGEFLAIVGPNGCGKSTTLRLLAGLERPDAGQVLVMGREAASYSRRAFARHVALLTQGVGVPHALVARDMVAMGRHARQGFLNRRSREDDAAIDRALEEMEVADLAHRRMIPEGVARANVSAEIAGSLTADVLVLTYLQSRDETAETTRAEFAQVVPGFLDHLAGQGTTILTLPRERVYPTSFKGAAEVLAALPEGFCG